MWKSLIVMTILAKVTTSTTSGPCSDSSSCHIDGSHLFATSFEFLNKFTEKNYRTIYMLTISNASVNKIDPKLKYFKHLKYLDLSNNNVQISSIPSLNSLEELKLSANSLKRVNISALPHQIKDLDLSNNLLTEVPKDIRALQSLKTLHLQKNPIDCDCMNVIMYETLLKSGVNIPEPVMCHSPKKYSGKDISTVNCTLGDVMLNDDYEGSGASDIFEDSPISNVPFVPEEEDVIVDNNTIIDDRLPEEELIKTQGPENVLGPVIEEEGSGDEGSGYIMLPDSGILGCIENCSTPGPVGTHDEASASAPPSVVDQFGMLWEDINPFKEREESTKVSSTTSHPKDFAKEPRMFKETVPTIEKNSVKDEDVEVVSNRTQAKEMERASVAPQNSNAVYAIVGIGVFLAFVFLICFIKKRKTSRNSKHKRQIPQLGEEMKPLTKPLIQAVNEKPSKNIPEHIPLINGQNGKPKNDAPLLTSFTPLAHPEFTKEGDLPQDQDHDEVEMRTKYQPELLTPQRERVTIRESEIPDSIPKTPLLVHRQKNSEGEIVTTVVP